MTKGKWFLLSGILILSAILIQLLKLILKFNIDIIDDFSVAFLGVGIGILLVTLFKRKNK
jgi:glycopeptide antibiotics resistance protein